MRPVTWLALSRLTGCFGLLGLMYLADSVAQFSHNRSVLLTLAVLGLLAVAAGAAVPRRRLLTVLAGGSLALILGLTLVPNGGWRAFALEPGAVNSVLTNLRPHATSLTGWYYNSDGPANVALFVPAGLLLTVLTRHALRVLVGLTVLSLAIEAYQATLTTRVGTFDDVVANGLGAAIGAAVGAVILLGTRAARRPYAGLATDPRNIRR